MLARKVYKWVIVRGFYFNVTVQFTVVGVVVLCSNFLMSVWAYYYAVFLHIILIIHSQWNLQDVYVYIQCSVFIKIDVNQHIEYSKFFLLQVSDASQDDFHCNKSWFHFTFLSHMILLTSEYLAVYDNFLVKIMSWIDLFEKILYFLKLDWS